MVKRVIVVGGGASGMMAAIFAGEQGAQVTLLEKNDILGKKMLISGKGRCNITNDRDLEDLIHAFAHNGRFLYTAFHSFSNQHTKYFFEEAGVPLKVERGERVFPVSDRSKDIVDVMQKKLIENKVKIRKNTEVKQILQEHGRITSVVLSSGDMLPADCVIVATGGASYPGTGSTGDGYGFAKKLGHQIVPLRPALVPLECQEAWMKSLQGLSLKNVKLTITSRDNTHIAEEFGEMLFTHFGISGPIVLTVSSKAVDYWQQTKQPLHAEIDFKPALTEEKLNARVLREIEEQNKKILKNSLHTLMPSKLIPVFIKLCGISGEKTMHQITKEERLQMVQLLKHFPFTLTKPRPLEEAIVTAGGVNVKEIYPKTMESRLVSGLYFTGEVLDLDGITGGFNLQAALSTGYLAGIACAN